MATFTPESTQSPDATQYPEHNNDEFGLERRRLVLSGIHIPATSEILELNSITVPFEGQTQFLKRYKKHAEELGCGLEPAQLHQQVRGRIELEIQSERKTLRKTAKAEVLGFYFSLLQRLPSALAVHLADFFATDSFVSTQHVKSVLGCLNELIEQQEKQTSYAKSPGNTRYKSRSQADTVRGQSRVAKPSTSNSHRTRRPIQCRNNEVRDSPSCRKSKRIASMKEGEQAKKEKEQVLQEKSPARNN